MIFATLLMLLSLSRSTSDRVRGKTIAMLAPIWEGVAKVKTKAASIFRRQDLLPPSSEMNGNLAFIQEEMQRLQLENQLLLNQVTDLNLFLDDKEQLDKQRLQVDPEIWEAQNEAYQKYVKRMQHVSDQKMQSLPAKVIFRSLDTWNQSLWVNVGSMHNAEDSKPIVAKNSPVVVGNAIVGVIDYVGKAQSRVRLMTDRALVPSVRVARGGEQEGVVTEHIDFLLSRLNRTKKLTIEEKEQHALIQSLSLLKSKLQPMKHSWYLAKGELYGCHEMAGRQMCPILRGTGFNYDFADEEGEGRDLRTGKLVHDPASPAVPILKMHDVLVTTGMDGIFPAGFKVATVTKIQLLKEGDYFYELEAEPILRNLNDVSIVFVLPPIGYDPLDTTD